MNPERLLKLKQKFRKGRKTETHTPPIDCLFSKCPQWPRDGERNVIRVSPLLWQELNHLSRPCFIQVTYVGSRVPSIPSTPAVIFFSQSTSSELDWKWNYQGMNSCYYRILVFQATASPAMPCYVPQNLASDIFSLASSLTCIPWLMAPSSLDLITVYWAHYLALIIWFHIVTRITLCLPR